ncbi:MAG: GNAT family N-acetyltransferase [Treponema sp.]|jgi:ribosomal protein S18 acetylase RimI-like enzyme|nr:GNAT family N-acetyltransferase [Treponema sp.]
METNERTVSIKELDANDNFFELLDLSKDFFYEYENNKKEFFEVDTIDEIDIKNYFQKFIGNEKAKAFIAVINEKIIGYITVYIKDQPNYWKLKKVGDISGLMVNKNFRQNGIGTKLIIKGLEYFKQENIKYYTLFTSVNNTTAIKLYKKCGLKPLQTILYGEIE